MMGRLTVATLEERYRNNKVKRTTTSIFDLSPAEKLQLLEDLWDDLAATLEAVPVQDW
jgi:hypothetical protein